LTFEKIIGQMPPEQAETTVKCPAIGVVLVLEFWLKLYLTSISRLKRTKNRPDSNLVPRLARQFFFFVQPGILYHISMIDICDAK
jgi:hypothetical protein